MVDVGAACDSPLAGNEGRHEANQSKTSHGGLEQFSNKGVEGERCGQEDGGIPMEGEGIIFLRAGY